MPSRTGMSNSITLHYVTLYYIILKTKTRKRAAANSERDMEDKGVRVPLSVTARRRQASVI